MISVLCCHHGLGCPKGHPKIVDGFDGSMFLTLHMRMPLTPSNARNFARFSFSHDKNLGFDFDSAGLGLGTVSSSVSARNISRSVKIMMSVKIEK